MFTSCRPTNNSSRRPRTRLQVECLEDRAVPSATSLLEDSFSNNTLNLDAWTSGLTDPEGNPAGIRVENQRLEFTGPGTLITREEFVPTLDQPIEVSGVWTWTPTAGLVGSAQVVTRQSGTFSTYNGVEFRADPGVGLTIWVWQDQQTRLLALAPLRIDVGDTFQFRVRDDGAAVSFSLAEIGGQGAAVSVAAETSLVSDAHHVAFRYGGVVFGSAARLALDDVSVTPIDPESSPQVPLLPTLPTAPTPPSSRSAGLVFAIALDYAVDSDTEAESSPTVGGREMVRQIRVRRSRLRRAGGRKLRQTITLENTSNFAVADLRLAFARLPKGARLRLAGGTWVNAAQAARGIGLEDDYLNPGQSVTIEIELNVAGSGRPRFQTRVLGSLEAPQTMATDAGLSISEPSGAASSAWSFRDRNS